MKKRSCDRVTPNSKRRENLEPKSGSTFSTPEFGVAAQSPSVYVKTFGCQMNVRDSEVICGLLKAEDWKLAANPDEADVIIFNTCSVRQHAEDKVWSEVGRYAKRRTKDEGRRTARRCTPYAVHRTPIIGIVGCMAQNYQENIFERAPQIDFVVGPSDIHKIPGIIKRLSTIDHRQSTQSFFETKIWETDGGIRPEEIYHTGYYEDKEHAYVVVSEGCSNYCSYCVVPYVRGELRNRPHKEILREIEEAVSSGITKFTLLGQNVNAYKTQDTRHPSAPLRAGKTQVDFIELLREVNRIKGLKEFSFVTSHPKDTSLELFRAMAESDKLKKYLHLPVQSGSDRILKLMSRGYTKKFYLDLIESYRKIVKKGVLTTDIIVGFPTESEEDFKDTYNLVKDAQFNASFIFKYSPRPHTEAAKFADNVERKEKERRHRLILELQKSISKKSTNVGK
jgi:tRNA-2-methylthio-N6-dimethylallyladenosine synthase